MGSERDPPRFRFEEGDGHNLKVYTITELLSSANSRTRARAMSHCVGSYAASCAAGRTSIWVLKVTDAYGRETTAADSWRSGARSRQIVQAPQKFNKEASPRELSILKRWASGRTELVEAAGKVRCQHSWMIEVRHGLGVRYGAPGPGAC